MLSGSDKAIAAFVASLATFAGAYGFDFLGSAEAQIALASVITGVVTWFIPNKGAKK